jgi:hypothetical protein
VQLCLRHLVSLSCLRAAVRCGDLVAIIRMRHMTDLTWSVTQVICHEALLVSLLESTASSVPCTQIQSVLVNALKFGLGLTRLTYYKHVHSVLNPSTWIVIDL